MKSFKEFTFDMRTDNDLRMLFELFLVGNEEPDSFVFCFWNKVYIFKLEQFREYKPKIVEGLERFFEDDKEQQEFLKINNFVDFIKKITDRFVDLLIGKIDIVDGKKELTIINKYKHDVYYSTLLRQLQKTLKTTKIKLLYDDVETIELDLPLSKNKMVGYHGTNHHRLHEILKLGLRPNQTGHWESSKHIKDLLFFSTDYSIAMGHANKSCHLMTNDDKFQSLPVILKFEIPDENKLVQDFDMENMTGKAEIYNRPEFSKLKNRQSIKNDPFKLSRELGIYGYKGNILPNHILSIYVPSEKSLKGRIKRKSFNNNFVGQEFEEFNKKQIISYLDKINN